MGQCLTINGGVQGTSPRRKALRIKERANDQDGGLREEPKVLKRRDWEWEGILHHRGEAKGVFGARVGVLPAAFADGRGSS